MTFVRVTGADAANFLNGQFTQDTLNMATGEHRIGAFCMPKGRAIAVAFLIAIENGFELWTHSSVIESLVATLQRYVMRADVRFESMGETPLERVIDLPLIGATLDLASADFAAAALAAGVPTVEAETSGEFVPQMINLDLVGGIDFAKGCYTGQEIVARTHNLGTIKRRMLAFVVNGSPPAAGSDVLDASGARIGQVVTASDGTVLAVVRLSHIEDAVLAGDTRIDGVRPLPYDIPELLEQD